MVLKKVISVNKNEQMETDMTPHEEEEIRAHWAVGVNLKTEPQKPTIEQEHEWLIEHGADYVKQQRTAWGVAHDGWKLNHQPLVDAHRSAADIYEKSTLDIRK